MVRLVKHGLEKFGFESIGNNDKSLSESQLDHEMVDRFFEVVLKVVLECRHGKGYCVVREINDELVEEVEKSWDGGLSKTLMFEEGRFEGDEDGSKV
ncbi:hypothetical protein Tco_0183794 [Tanacetum coccineum]